MSKRRKNHGIRGKPQENPETFVSVVVDAQGDATIQTNIASDPDRMFDLLLTGARAVYKHARGLEEEKEPEPRIVKPRLGLHLPKNGR